MKLQLASQRRTFAEILLITSTVLLLELALIRWLPANIYSLAFFANQVLLATFYGFGLGNLMGGWRRSLIKIWPFYVLFFLVLVLGLRELDVLIPERSIEWIWSRYQADQITRGTRSLPLELVLIVLFFLVAFLFVPLGQQLARAMTRVESLSFYNFDLLGSLLGIAVFSFMSAAGLSPLSWFFVVAALAAPVHLFASGRRGLLFVLPLIAGVGLVGFSGRGEMWSPYYSILTRQDEKSRNFKVYVNRLYHQEAIDLEHAEIPGYVLPYRFFDGGRVLVVGAGTGNDVAVALRNGATAVDAVEIDPVIRRLGDRHPLAPYADPRVNAIVQDARTYLQTTDQRYDMIVFGTLDSHALLSSVSTVRLDNYVYTTQSLRAAKRCLKDGGILAMLYSVPSERGRRWFWIRERLVAMAIRVFGAGRVLRFVSSSSFLNLVVIARNEVDFSKDERGYLESAPPKDTIVPTDDWPFLYLEKRALPGYHTTVLPAILILGTVPILWALPRGRRRPHWNFLVLGAAFLLVETATITRLSLLFGSTWVVNSVVFFSILSMVLLANLVVQRTRRFPVRAAYAGLGTALLCNYFLSVEHLLYASFATKVVVASLFAGAPIFFAGIVFSSLFRREEGAALRYAFGSNLLGAFVGGFSEYLGLIIGFNHLILVIAALYSISYLLTTRALAGPP